MKIKLILSMLFLLCSVSVNAESIEWKTDNDTLIISGSGEMTDYSAQNKAPWSDTEFKKLVVNEGITSIGDWCFADCTDLEQLTLPSTLKSIGERAFYNCIELDEIIIPDNVSEIKSGAFNSCIQAKKVSLPDKLTYIGDSSFMNLPALSAVVIPENVNYIGSWAFFGNTSMTGLYFKGNVPEYIGNYLIAGINEDRFSLLNLLSNSFTRCSKPSRGSVQHFRSARASLSVSVKDASFVSRCFLQDLRTLDTSAFKFTSSQFRTEGNLPKSIFVVQHLSHDKSSASRFNSAILSSNTGIYASSIPLPGNLFLALSILAVCWWRKDDISLSKYLPQTVSETELAPSQEIICLQASIQLSGSG